MDELNYSGTSLSSPASAGGCPPVVEFSNEMQWFVMRVTYSRELKAQKALNEVGVQTFIPMLCERVEGGRRYRPAVHNLIFVRSSREFLDTFKRKVEDECSLRYAIDRSTGLPMVVRDKEMADFIRVTADNDVLYLDNPMAVVTKGSAIEIVGGPFKGVKGRLLRIRRDRKVVLQLAGMVAVAVDGVPMEWCKLIKTL